MIKYLLITLFIVSAVNVSAQTVITDPTINGLIGSSMNLKIVGNAPASVAQTGANVNWDPSTATFTQAATLEFVDPSGTPYGSQYPAANMANVMVSQNQTSYDYVLSTSGALENLAEAINTGSPKIFNNYKTTNVFPMSYLDSFSDTYQLSGGPLETNVRTYDSWGMLTALGHTWTNVARIVYDNGQRAQWYSTSPFLPLLVYDGSQLIFCEPVTIAGIKHNPAPASFSIYPNPSSDVITIALNQPGASSAQITDAAGHIISTFELNNVYTYPTSALESGIYFCRVNTPTGNTVSRFVKN